MLTPSQQEAEDVSGEFPVLQPGEQVSLSLLMETLREIKREIREIRREIRDDQAVRQGACQSQQATCRSDLSEIYDRIKILERHKTRHEALIERKTEDQKTKPHWHVALATYALAAFTVFLMIEAMIRIWGHK